MGFQVKPLASHAACGLLDTTDKPCAQAMALGGIHKIEFLHLSGVRKALELSKPSATNHLPRGIDGYVIRTVGRVSVVE